MHPLQVNIKDLSDKDLEEKIQELTRKYFQALRFSPSIANQIVLLLDGYKIEQQERLIAKSNGSNGDDELNELIKVN